MKGEILSSLEAAAYGAKASSVESVPNFPAPFSIDIGKKLASIHKCDIFNVDTVSSAISAAIGSAASGKRVFLPASSPLCYEAFSAPFMRLPFVICNVARSMHGIKPDNSAVMALRDAGYLMFFPESNQEIQDTVVQAYRTIEDGKVLLPAIINIDGLPNFSEPCQVVNEKLVALQKPRTPRLDTKKPLHFDIYSDNYQEGKLSMNKSMENALEVIKKVDEQWKQRFKRGYGLVEKFAMDDAETVIVIMGYHSATAKAAVRRLRAAGKKVGLLRIRVFRPWPSALVASALAGAKKVLVFEQAVSLGATGILRAHVGKGSTLVCLGKYPSEKDFSEAVEKVEKSDKDLRLWL